jgi:tetraacyldisaccharide-1-P 4'-kinase
VFGGLVHLRRVVYAGRRSTASSLPVPVIVVGNNTAGGAG